MYKFFGILIVVLAIVSVALSSLIPALKLSRQELAIAMRE